MKTFIHGMGIGAMICGVVSAIPKPDISIAFGVCALAVGVLCYAWD